jgi:hypothetical protein
VANYYTGEVQAFGLFDYSGAPKSSFYAFKAFRQLLDTPRRVKVRVAGAGMRELAVLAGVDAARTRAGVLVSQVHGAGGEMEISWPALPWPGPGAVLVSMAEATPGLRETQRAMVEPGPGTVRFRLAAPGVALVRVEAMGGKAGIKSKVLKP